MRSAVAGTLGVLVVCLGFASPVFAQKGVGDPSGVARQAVKPAIVSLSGKLVEVKTEACELTTGRSPIGTHVILEAAKERLNIHFGPAAAVADIVAKLSVGQQLTVKAFRTEKMKEKHFVAQSLAFGETTIELRDANLQPVWAGGNVGPRGAGAGQAGFGGGRGQGWGRGAGWGRGPGSGRGAGWGCGQQWLAPPQSGTTLPKERLGKIAVTAMEPSLDAAVDPQFGRCRYFLLVDADRDAFEVVENTNTAGGNAGGQAADLIAKKGAKVLLTGKCGANASGALAAAGIQVVPGCAGTVRDVVKQFRAGQLTPAGKKTPAPPAASGK